MRRILWIICAACLAAPGCADFARAETRNHQLVSLRGTDKQYSRPPLEYPPTGGNESIPWRLAASAEPDYRAIHRRPDIYDFTDPGAMQSIHSTSPTIFQFGKFELIPAMRMLATEGRIIKIGGRALDLLCILVERAGKIVTKSELMAKVWSNLSVEDNNIRVHISTLRRMLGDDGTEFPYIVHVARRGYVFVAPLMIKQVRACTGSAFSCPIEREKPFGATGVIRAAPLVHWS